MESFSRKIIATEDGSHTMAIPDLGITYHSTHGAIQESEHVFIKAGLHYALEHFPQDDIHILEMGFGTGLNALLTILESWKYARNIEYITIEQFPLTVQEAGTLNYVNILGQASTFKALHDAEWNKQVSITPVFKLHKLKADLVNWELTASFHVIYYDAFAPEAQPELWTENIFRKLYDALAEGGVLTTYCSKGSVRRAMVAAGFTVKKIPGPPGKREMVQAFKNSMAKGG